jgi:hypothetical protein
MTRFDGTAARQLDLIPVTESQVSTTQGPAAPPSACSNRRLQGTVRRRRQAQMAARHALNARSRFAD